MNRRLSLAALPLIAIGIATLIACGGGGEPGSDEEYVAAMCTTVTAFQQRLETAQGSAPAIVDALEDAADAFNDANPPDDVADAHSRLVRAFRDAAEAIEDNDAGALQRFDPEAMDPPQAVKQRLAAAAAQAPECQGLGIFQL